MNDAGASSFFAITDPATLERGKSYPGHSPQQAPLNVTRAPEAQGQWRRTGFDERPRMMLAAAAVLRG